MTKALLFSLPCLVACVTGWVSASPGGQESDRFSLTGSNGRTYLLENLGAPIPPAPVEVNFTTETPSEETIAWGRVRSPLQSGVNGVNIETGEVHWIELKDKTVDKIVVFPHEGTIWMVAGNPLRVYSYDPETRDIVEEHEFPLALGYYFIGYARSPDGKAYIGVFPSGSVIEIDHAKKQFRNLGNVTGSSEQKYVLLPVYDDEGYLYSPSGFKYGDVIISRPDDPTFEPRSLLNEEQRNLFDAKPVTMPKMQLIHGSAYVLAADQYYQATPEGLIPLTVQPSGWKDDNRKRALANARLPYPSTKDGRLLIEFTEEGVRFAKGNTRGIIAANEEVVLKANEIFNVSREIDGRILGSGIFPGKLFAFDERSEGFESFGVVTSGQIQVYDSYKADGSLVLSSYLGAFLEVFDYEAFSRGDFRRIQQWSLFPFEQERAPRLASDGAGKLFVGTTPTKGQLGGGIARIDLEQMEMLFERNVVPEQKISDVLWLPQQSRLLALSSIRGGSGSTPTEKEAVVALVDPESLEVEETLTPLPGASEYVAPVMNADGSVLFFGRLSGRSYWMVLDPESGEITEPTLLPGDYRRVPQTVPVKVSLDRRTVFKYGPDIYEFIVEDGDTGSIGVSRVEHLVKVPVLEFSRQFVLSDKGYLYAGSGKDLYRVRLFEEN